MSSSIARTLKQNWLAGMVMLAGFMTLGACSVSEPLAVHSSLDGVFGPQSSIVLALPESDEQAELSQYATALHQSFSQHGWAVSPDGQLIADYAISQGNASLGVQQASSGANTAQPDNDETVWISPPRETRRFDECKAQELRGTLVLINRANGSIAYRGKGSVIECEFNHAAIGELADALVADFMAKSAR